MFLVSFTSSLLFLNTSPEFSILGASQQNDNGITSICTPNTDYVSTGELTENSLDKEIDLDGDSYAETRLISLVQEGRSDRISDFRILECQGGEWVTVFHITPADDCSFAFEEVEVMEDDSQQVLVQQVCGSGGFLYFSLLGYKERNIFQRIMSYFTDPENNNGSQNNVRVLLSNSNIISEDEDDKSLFSGSVYPTEKGLVVAEGDITWLYQWDGNKFVGERDSIFPSDAHVVKYWWDENGKPLNDLNGSPKTFNALENDTIHLSLGQKVYIVRDHENDQSTSPSRIMMADISLSNPIAFSDEPGLVLEARNVGEFNVSFENPAYSGEFIGFRVIVTE